MKVVKVKTSPRNCLSPKEAKERTTKGMRDSEWGQFVQRQGHGQNSNGTGGLGGSSVSVMIPDRILGRAPVWTTSALLKYLGVMEY